MFRKNIRLRTLEDAKQLVALANACDFDIDVGYQRVMIDGKSILGVLGLDFNRVITVSMNGRDEAFERFLDSKSLDASSAA
ncbi:MAG: HPr family phosphocarrier protein [Lachnospiraceae bacterium]|jgi:phosphotransferase system HPr-like phosphotransfer protein|nr:HPr family phosphocarrier protein [Lachnospiraceae bacterium]